MVQKHMAPGSFFKSSAKKAEECCMKRISMRQTGGLWMPELRGWAHAILLAQLKEKPGSTPNEMMKPRGQYIPPKSAAMKKNIGLGQGKGPLTLQEYIPEYNCPRMRR